MYVISRIDNLGSLVNTTVNGTAWTKLIAVPDHRRIAVRVTNNDSSRNIYLTYVAAGTAAPTTAMATQYEDVVGPKTTLTLPLNGSIDVYAANDSGAATTSLVTVREMK
jgi:hypothetical protein